MKALLQEIKNNVVQGRRNKYDEGIDTSLDGTPGVEELVTAAVEKGIDLKEILNEGLIRGMKEVGKKYESGEYYIPDMLAAAEATGAAMNILEPHMLKSGVENKGKFIIATVQGDQHDIGKNIVAIMLRGAGFEVIDLGTDVPSDVVVKKARETGADLLGLSALLTTTMRFMGETIRKLETEGIRSSIRVLIGGAPTSAAFAREIKADAYCEDAFKAVETAEKLVKTCERK